MSDRQNSAKGRTSFDITQGNVLVSFFNRNVTPYATESGGPKFDLIPVEKQKDIMVNAARMHAEQEYNRIIELVAVLQKQANEIRKRLDLTDMVHAAKYDFQTYHGQTYWLVYDSRKDFYRLVKHGPNEWSAGAPAEYKYITKVKWLGDYTWTEVEE